MAKYDPNQPEFKDKPIARRKFIRNASLLGAGVALSPLMLGGKALAASPVQGGTFRVGHGGLATTDTLNPAVANSNGVSMLQMQLRNLLVEEVAGGELVPELAESWEPSKDVKQWTFKIRKGVEFHDGKPLTADDVVYSLNIHRGEDSKSAAKGYVSNIEELKTDGKHTVVIKLKGGDIDFPAIMSYPMLQIVPEGTKDFEKGMGTGGYILEEHVPGVRAITKRNPNYWKAGRAHFDAVEMIAIADVNARTTAVRTGKVDAMNDCDLKTVRFLGKAPNVQIVRVSGKKHHLFPMRTDTKPYNDNNLRMALKFAIDREAILKQVMHGFGSLGNDHPISSKMRFFAKGIPQRQYDPDKAKFYMKKAGLEGQEFALHVADTPFSGAVDTAMLYQDSAGKAGVKIKVVREPQDGYWSNVWMKKPWFASKWSGRINEGMMFSAAYAADAAWNETFWKNDRFNELLKAARIEMDENKRAEMYAEMQLLVRDDGGSIIPVFGDLVDAASSKIQFGELASNFELDGFRASERWWFKS